MTGKETCDVAGWQPGGWSYRTFRALRGSYSARPHIGRPLPTLEVCPFRDFAGLSVVGNGLDRRRELLTLALHGALPRVPGAGPKRESLASALMHPAFHSLVTSTLPTSTNIRTCFYYGVCDAMCHHSYRGCCIYYANRLYCEKLNNVTVSRQDDFPTFKPSPAPRHD